MARCAVRAAQRRDEGHPIESWVICSARYYAGGDAVARRPYQFRFFIFISRRKLQLGSVSKLRKQLDRFLAKQPKLGKGVYIARGAAVLGDVTLGDYSSVWYNAVLRGDINRIVVGHHSNVQDNAVLHLADDYPCIVGNYVTIGHSAVVHACTVGDETLVGMGAVILDGAVIGKQCIIGAKALVTQGTKIPAGSMVLGAPARVVRKLTREERAGLKAWAQKYVENSAYCLKNKDRLHVINP
jgi:carbonic anhydrase/acetyltransferase-like protein (isoleucine patch superfamily)